jgi:hypothetical protein
MAKRTKTSVKKSLDKLWSAIVKKNAGYKCEVCGLDQHHCKLNSHHIEGRRNLRLRWDLQNGVCLCSGCHTFRKESAHQSPEWFHFWLEENRWEDLQYIMCVRNEIVKYSMDDYLELEKELKELI